MARGISCNLVLLILLNLNNAEGGYYVTIPLKFSLVFCCTIFSIGFLFYLNVLNAPRINFGKYFNKLSGD